MIQAISQAKISTSLFCSLINKEVWLKHFVLLELYALFSQFPMYTSQYQGGPCMAGGGGDG